MPKKYFNHSYLVDYHGFVPIKESEPYKKMIYNSNKNNSSNPIMNKILKYLFCIVSSVCCYYAFFF